MLESCDGCEYWIRPECRRYPPTKDGYPIAHRGCGEHKAKEAIICPVVEKAVEKEPPKVEAPEVESPKVEKEKASKPIFSFIPEKHGVGRPPKKR